MNHAARVYRRSGASNVLLALVWCSIVVSQLRAQNHDWRGYEFWVAFMENHGSGGRDEHSDLRIYLSCDRPTQALITFNATGETHVVSLPAANTSVEVNINELFGDDVELVGTSAGDEISNRSLRVTSNDEITLYGANIRNKSSDAFLALPEDVLTRNYIVMAYTNGYDIFAPANYDMPSEFAVVATEDGTTVNIRPAPGTNINGRPDDQSFTVLLDRGAVFFAQAQIGVEQDLSGTEVTSNKPVAVFGGVRRASVPTIIGNYRDHLCAQIPPLEVWGREAILVPHFPVTPGATDPAIARILAALDNTKWTLNGVPQQPLQRGRPFELQLQYPQVVTADGPILVGQFEHSVHVQDSLGRSELGDPFMMLIPSSEQYDTAYAFQAIIHPEFLRHFINIVIPTAAAQSVLLDDAALSATFQPVPNSRYSYAQIEVSAGAHYIRADSAFGLYSYGFGRANSYGYAGGSLYYQLVSDYQHPEIASVVVCHALNGVATDSRLLDSGVDSCYTLSDTANVTIDIAQFSSGVDTVRFAARLIDPYQDGRAVLKAIDKEGRSTTLKTDIPGYTLRAVGMQGTAPVQLDTLVLFNGGEFCRRIQVENYGAYPQTIDSVWLLKNFGQKFRVRTNLPLVIPAGKRSTLDICLRGWVDSVVAVTVVIGDSCTSRSVALVPLMSGIDTAAPALTTTSGRCTDEIILTFSEVQERFSGINRIQFDTLINCSGSYQPGEDKFPSQSLSMRIRRINPRLDMIYQVTVIDASGNSRTAIDTIGGFTLAVTGRTGEMVGITRNRAWVGDSLPSLTTRCDSVELHNFGHRTLRLDWARMLGNQSYSIPPTQLPITIPAYSSRKVLVCCEGRGAGDMTDTLVIAGECGDEESVVMKVPVIRSQASGLDGCNSMIHLDPAAAKRAFLSSPVPNPITGSEMRVDIGLAQQEHVTLEVVDAHGNVKLAVLRNALLDAGVTRIGIDVSSLSQGAYYFHLRTEHGEIQVENAIITR